MPKILSAMGLAALFFGGGVYLLCLASKNMSAKTHLVIEDPQCNDSEYFYYGSSLLPDLQAKDINNPSMKANNDDFLVIADGQSMHGILSEKNISSQEIYALSTALQPYLRAKDLAPGDLYGVDIVMSPDQQPMVQSFVIKKLDSNRLPITYEARRESLLDDNPKFKITLNEAAIREEVELIQVDVSGTLYRSFMSLAFGNELMQRLMNIFAWRMRMPGEVFSKDHIEILVIKKYAENNFIGYGRIQSVYYRQTLRTLFATHFRSKDGKIDGVYDEFGKAMEKEFSLSPVYETVATSEQNWRVHPVRKVRIRHNGIDFRGTIGTAFFAVADGEVIEKRFDRMVGNMIRIRHKYGLHSEYFHADSLMSTLAVGSRVKRGQKLGEIGNTGVLCTGPHLHLGIYQMANEKRKYVDILNFRKKLADMPALTGQYLAEFNDHMKKSIAMMDSMKALALSKNGSKTSASR